MQRLQRNRILWIWRHLHLSPRSWQYNDWMAAGAAVGGAAKERTAKEGVLDDVTKRDEQTTAVGGEPAGEGQETGPSMVTSGRSSYNVGGEEIDTSGWIKVRNKRRGNRTLSETKSELASGWSK
mmetsp:Transcript_20886/g.35623  ORF Transcript_20886/g.35623 Transcript_20886/m.35623 type:complete len:124 (+) Transcript_20886:396-767(+)